MRGEGEARERVRTELTARREGLWWMSGVVLLLQWKSALILIQ